MFKSVILLCLYVAACINIVIADNWEFSFNHSIADQVEMGCNMQIRFNVTTDSFWENEVFKIKIVSSDEDVAFPRPQYFDLPLSNNNTNTWTNTFNVTTEFLGYTKMSIQIVELGESSASNNCCILTEIISLKCKC